MRPSHRGPGLGGAAGARPQRGPAGCTRERAKHRPALRGSRPGTFSAPPRAVRALTPSGLVATAKFIPRRAWTAGSRGGGLVRAQCPRSLHRFHPPAPPHPALPEARAQGLSGRQLGPRGPCCPRPASRGPTSRSRPLSARGRLRRGRRHLPRAGSSARAARSGPSALTHARSR